MKGSPFISWICHFQYLLEIVATSVSHIFLHLCHLYTVEASLTRSQAVLAWRRHGVVMIFKEPFTDIENCRWAGLVKDRESRNVSSKILGMKVCYDAQDIYSLLVDVRFASLNLPTLLQGYTKKQPGKPKDCCEVLTGAEGSWTISVVTRVHGVNSWRWVGSARIKKKKLLPSFSLNMEL